MSASQLQLDPSKLNDADKKELTQFITGEAQKTNIQTNIHNLTDLCWKKCITQNVGSGNLTSNEDSCAQNCVNRWMDVNFAMLNHLESLRNSH